MAGDVALEARTSIFFTIRDLVHEHREDLARFLTAEHGKVLSDAMGEVARGLEVIEYCCGIPTLLKGEFSEQASTGIDVYSIRQPLGVVAGITPFNFPAMVPMWMWAPALACGNTFVLKPSEKDPSASLLHGAAAAGGGRARRRLQRRARRQGRGRRGAGASRHLRGLVRRLDADRAATSTRPARRRASAYQALGGAKNHMIVLPDADMDMAADAAVSAAYGSAGERCMAISQVVAVGDAADRSSPRSSSGSRRSRSATGFEPDVEMGPLVTREHRDKVAAYIDGARGQGADVVADGRETAPDGDGFFLGVSLLDNVTPEMDAYKDEIFGPVLGVTRVGTYNEAVSS